MTRTMTGIRFWGTGGTDLLGGGVACHHKKSGEREVRRGNPLALLKEYYDEFEIHKENDELNFFWRTGGQCRLRFYPLLGKTAGEESG